ncbi:acylneuraminate cytidylyltransferase [bacterium SM23_57]|nr:MAG: acylneuraminate cytidylyltransferase [bacterium SM23_57]
MKTVAIIQARMGSTRLPGKVLLPIGHLSMLARVINRVRRAQSVDEIVVATSINPEDDRIAEEAKLHNVQVFRGDENDVLDRYYQASKQCGATTIVRITADCPMIDPEVIDQVMLVFMQKKPDYASNCLQRTYPRGLDVEVMTFDALEKAWSEAKFTFQRSHVTPYIHKNPDQFNLESVTSGTDSSHFRWTVDTKEDLELVRTLYARFGHADTFTWQDAMMLMNLDPNLASINKHVQQKELQEG